MQLGATAVESEKLRVERLRAAGGTEPELEVIANNLIDTIEACLMPVCQ